MSDLLTDPAATPPAAAPAPTPPAAATPDAPDLPAPEVPSWMATLPKDIKESPSIGRYKESGVEGLARAYLNAEKLIGSDKVPVPKDQNDNEAWERYYKAGGRPDDPTKYEFQKPEKLPDGVNYDEGMETWWRQSAHESGLSQRQATKLFEKYRDRFFSQIELGDKSATTETENARLALQRDWGTEFESRRTLAKAAFAEMPEDVKAAAVRSGLARMPSFVKYLHDIRSKTTGEADPKRGEVNAASPDHIKGQVAEHRARHAAALMDGTHPEHQLRTTELEEMYRKLFPSEAA